VYVLLLGTSGAIKSALQLLSKLRQCRKVRAGLELQLEHHGMRPKQGTIGRICHLSIKRRQNGFCRLSVTQTASLIVAILKPARHTLGRCTLCNDLTALVNFDMLASTSKSPPLHHFGMLFLRSFLQREGLDTSIGCTCACLARIRPLFSTTVCLVYPLTLCWCFLHLE
jgi:hypothetical protein